MLSLLAEAGAGLAAGFITKHVSKRMGRGFHKVGAPLAAVGAAALANQLGADVSAEGVQQSAELWQSTQGGALAVLMHSLFAGGKETVRARKRP